MQAPEDYTKKLPREIRELLGQYATSGPYIFNKLPPDVQARLIMFLPPEEILTLRKIAPEILLQPDEFWKEKIRRDFGSKNIMYIIDGFSDYAVYMIGTSVDPETRKWVDSSGVTHTMIRYAERTGDYEVIDRLMSVAPGITIFVGVSQLYDYIFDNYPKYRVPLTVFDMVMQRGKRHVQVTREEQERWERMLRNIEGFVRMIDNL